MRPVLPLHAALVHELDVDLVHQGGGGSV
jgi:hypothetical protein